ncbi:MAG: helix-turn-helix domain-containing protein [Acetobacter sp.]|nr:helix-turn-helix domain-containing protein [Bacteroides sp.]MCM1341646.1 helix-turn-helix domain-containing protein [Acetobacter sp.]MCM1434033.1 helix-turn-helix domain-containing protein [Clostridiales bacterium]
MNTRNIIQKSLDYIEDNLKAEISVVELCDMAGYSCVHYCRLFQSFVGMSVNEYINRRKLLYAVYDMSNGLTKIDIALNYGYETYAGFYKAFKREFNCSPSEFIKSYKGNKPYRINILQEEHIMISKNKVQKLLVEWGLQDNKITNIYNENTGRQSDNAYFIGSDYVIKFTNNLGSIKNNISISKAMMNAGIPTFEIVKTINGEDYVQNGEFYFIITKRIKGEQLKCENIFNNTDLAFCIGGNIAKLHKALQTFDQSNYNYADVLSETKANLPKVKDLIAVDDFTNKFTTLYYNLPKQLIHRDINPSNMIFDNREFKGFIDFDLSEVNIRIFDICYCATAILSECFSNQDIDKKLWFEILNKLISGYETISPLTNEEKQAILYVICSIQIICIAYFRKFDKYEHLAKINVAMLKWIMDNDILELNK